MKKIISEAKRQERANEVKNAMLESFASTFNKIRRDNDSEIITEAAKKNSIEQKVRLSKGIASILNKQIENELYSSQIYRAFSAWLDDEGWIGGSELFFKYADEELGHMSKIYKYLYEKNARAIVPNVKNVPVNFENIRDVVVKALEHEMRVTKNWNDIANKAKGEDDNDTYSFALGYVNEQREEEEKIRNILFSMDLDMPKWKIDELFKNLL
jgi:ferritin